MRKIKSIFKNVETSYRSQGHHSSNGFVYTGYYSIDIVGPFLSEMLYLSYQDLKTIQEFINQCKKSHSSNSVVDDVSYDYGDYHETFEDFGFCTFFNDRFSSKYGITLTIGNISECSYLFEEEKSILSLVNEGIEKAEKQIEEQIANIQSDIMILKNKIDSFTNEIDALRSEESHRHFLCRQLYPILVEESADFNLNETIVCSLYPLDVALDFKDETLIDNLISHGAYRYSSHFIPQLSAKVGDYSHIKKLFKHEENLDEDINLFFEFLSKISPDEFNSFIFEKKSDVIRDGRILLKYREKRPIFLRLYSRRNSYNGILYEKVISFIRQYLEKKDFKTANKIICFCKDNSIFLDEDKVLRLSFEYGNLSYLKMFYIDDLIDKINKYNRFDDGYIFEISYYFENDVTIKNIGEEFFNDIKSYILKHYKYHPGFNSFLGGL